MPRHPSAKHLAPMEIEAEFNLPRFLRLFEIRTSHFSLFAGCLCFLWQKEKCSLLSLSKTVPRRFLSVIPLWSAVGRRPGLFCGRQPDICEKRLLILVNKNSRRPISKPCLSRKASSAEIDMPPRRPQAFVRGGNKTTAVFGAVPSGKNQHEFFTGSGASSSDQTVPEKTPPFLPPSAREASIQ